MLDIDIRTVFYFSILTNLVLLLVLSMLWYQNHARYSGVAFWVADAALQGSASLLIGFRGSVPDWASMVLANAMVVGGTLLLYFGLKSFFGRLRLTVVDYVALALFAAFVLVHSYFTFVRPDLLARSVNAAAGLSLASLLCIRATLRETPHGRRQTARGLRIALFGIILVEVIRIIGFILMPVAGDDYMRSGAFDALMVMVLEATFASLVFSLVLMVNGRLQEDLSELATHDALTGLPNRRLLYDRFEVALSNAQRNKKRLTLMSIDLDGFKNVNDSYGHDMGDKMLKAVGARLKQILRESDTVARVGGDEFVLLLGELDNNGDAVKVAQKIHDRFTESFTVEGRTLYSTASIGVAVYPENGRDFEELLKKSDESMYHVKNNGRNSYRLSNGHADS